LEKLKINSTKSTVYSCNFTLTSVDWGTRVWKSEDFWAWRRTKFDTELNINEKFKRILDVQGICSRIQVT
jgi:hypothetical protein